MTSEQWVPGSGFDCRILFPIQSHRGPNNQDLWVRDDRQEDRGLVWPSGRGSGSGCPLLLRASKEGPGGVPPVGRMAG